MLLLPLSVDLTSLQTPARRDTQGFAGSGGVSQVPGMMMQLQVLATGYWPSPSHFAFVHQKPIFCHGVSFHSTCRMHKKQNVCCTFSRMCNYNPKHHPRGISISPLACTHKSHAAHEAHQGIPVHQGTPWYVREKTRESTSSLLSSSSRRIIMTRCYTAAGEGVPTIQNISADVQ